MHIVNAFRSSKSRIFKKAFVKDKNDLLKLELFEKFKKKLNLMKINSLMAVLSSDKLL